MSETEKPLATFALFAYNQSKYIAEAVRGALSQTYTPLQIILSDDASSDDTYELICELVSKYDGPHEVVLNKNQRNLGIGGHVNKVMELARGEFIVVAAGDDISDGNRVAVIVDAFQQGRQAYSVWSAARYVDESGRGVDRRFPGRATEFTDKTMTRNIKPVIGATHAWRRSVFDFFGPLTRDVVFEDNAISFRSHLLGAIKYLDQELVSYRTHEKNITNFTKIQDLRELYSAATKRNEWALAGVMQREKDLKLAASKIAPLRRDYILIAQELSKMKAIIKRRIKAYRQFPALSFFVVFGAFFDIEVTKVALRSLKLRLLAVRDIVK